MVPWHPTSLRCAGCRHQTWSIKTAVPSIDGHLYRHVSAFTSCATQYGSRSQAPSGPPPTGARHAGIQGGLSPWQQLVSVMECSRPAAVSRQIRPPVVNLLFLMSGPLRRWIVCRLATRTAAKGAGHACKIPPAVVQEGGVGVGACEMAPNTLCIPQEHEQAGRSLAAAAPKPAFASAQHPPYFHLCHDSHWHQDCAPRCCLCLWVQIARRVRTWIPDWF